MVTASELRQGVALRIDKQIFRVTEVEFRPPIAQMGGAVHAHLSNLYSGRMWDQHFRPQEKLEEVELQKGQLEFLYSDGSTCTFLKLDSLEQVEFPPVALGLAAKLMQPGTEVPAEFCEGEPIRVVVPEVLKAHAVSTAPLSRSQQDSGRNEATLESGLMIRVLLFAGLGEMVTVDRMYGHYVERVQAPHKKGY